MDPKKDARICKKYPALYRQRNLPMTQTCLFWGLECGNGWEKIIDELSEAIVKAGNNQVKATQVKEKYGTLHFYVDYANEEVDSLILRAEIKSSKTCEVCGKPGKLNNGPWYSVRCPKCRAKENK